VITNGNEPAYPGMIGTQGYGSVMLQRDADRGDLFIELGHGLTKREYFAAMAMQGLLSSGLLSDTVGELVGLDAQYVSREIAETAMPEAERAIVVSAKRVADALLAELAKEPTK
jgi:hypothetical protein